MKFLILCVIFLSLSSFAESCMQDFILKAKKITPKYAKHFRVYYDEDFYLLVLKEQSLLLTRKESRLQVTKCLKDNSNKGPKFVNIPVKRLAVLSTSHVAVLKLLGVERQIFAFPNPPLIYTDEVKFDIGSIIDIFYPINLERLLLSSVDYVFAYATWGTEYESLLRFEKLSKEKTQVIFFSEFLEPDPLGRAEWIKVFALLFDQYKKGEQIFNEIERRYLALKSYNQTSLKRKNVLVGALNSNSFELVTENNIFTRVLLDANGKLLDTGFKSFEKILLNKEEFIWLPQNVFSIRKSVSFNFRYKLLNKNLYKIFTNTKKVNNIGGNDYWQTAFVRPDLLLKDLSLIFSDDKERLGFKIKGLFKTKLKEFLNEDLDSLTWYEEVKL